MGLLGTGLLGAAAGRLRPQKQDDLLQSWGMMVVALHTRPFQPGPLFFTAPLLFSSYISAAGYKIDSAAFGGTWSGIYALLAWRRKHKLREKLTVRGGVRGTAIVLGLMNCISGTWTYLTCDRELEIQQRRAENKLGIKKRVQ